MSEEAFLFCVELALGSRSTQVSSPWVVPSPASSFFLCSRQQMSCPGQPSPPDGSGSLTAIVNAESAFQKRRANQPGEKITLLSDEPPTACV